jgi:hypothetical protein
MAIGQENAFPWIERDLGIEFGEWEMPKVNTPSRSNPRFQKYSLAGFAFGPKNVITAVAHGHQAAVSIDLYCQEKDVFRTAISYDQSL